MHEYTKHYYMVLVRAKDNAENVISDCLYSNKAKARKEYKAWTKDDKYNVEVLHYTGETGDEMAIFEGTIEL